MIPAGTARRPPRPRRASGGTSVDLAGEQVEIDDGRRIDVDGLVIATGRRARELGGAPQAPRLRTMADALRPRPLLHSGPVHLVAVGGGLTGVQVAFADGWTIGADVVLTLRGRHPEHPVAERTGLGVANGVRTDDRYDWDNAGLRGTRAAAALLGQRPPSLATPTFAIRVHEHEARVVCLPRRTGVNRPRSHAGRQSIPPHGSHTPGG